MVVKMRRRRRRRLGERNVIQPVKTYFTVHRGLLWGDAAWHGASAAEWARESRSSSV